MTKILPSKTFLLCKFMNHISINYPLSPNENLVIVNFSSFSTYIKSNPKSCQFCLLYIPQSLLYIFQYFWSSFSGLHLHNWPPTSRLILLPRAESHLYAEVTITSIKHKVNIFLLWFFFFHTKVWFSFLFTIKRFWSLISPAARPPVTVPCLCETLLNYFQPSKL